ncbi:MAG: phosphate signaling complex protein PhoU [Acidimicrobiia bacterium]|nr:phosphate signaling complex protein PhoU [Acidimicrobiia bacterium]
MTETSGEPMGQVRKQFHEELDELQREIVRAAAMVTETIPRGTEVLLDSDLEGAQALIDNDDELDLLSLEIEELAVRVLTLQQPMASDLRAVVTALKMNGEIERSGDLVVNIAKGARRIYGVQFNPRTRGIIEQMSEEAVRLTRFAIDAYVERNASLAGALDDMDDRLDGLNKEFVRVIFEAHNDGEITLQAAVQLALVGRYYERIGDHAVNVGGMVQYMVTGWMPEHTGAARARARHEGTIDRSPGDQVSE